MADNSPQPLKGSLFSLQVLTVKPRVECRIESDTLRLSKGRYSPSQVIASYVELLK